MFLFHMWALASGLYICVYVGMASKETRKLGRSPESEGLWEAGGEHCMHEGKVE